MSGLLSLGKYQWLAPISDVDPVLLRHYLRVTQTIAESLTGLSLGSEVASVTAMSGNTKRITFYGGTYDVGQQVRLIGGGVTATPFTVTDAGVTIVAEEDAEDFFDDFFAANPDATTVPDGSLWIEVESDDDIAPTKILPVVEFVGEPQNLYLYCQPRPVFSVISVKTRCSEEVLWSDEQGISTLETDQYETFRSGSLPVGIQLKRSAIPRVSEGGEYLVKRMTRKYPSGIKVTYAAGFYSQTPADLEDAAMQLTVAIIGTAEGGGVFASESLDYYSYSTLSYEQLSTLPHAAVAILRRYSRM